MRGTTMERRLATPALPDRYWFGDVWRALSMPDTMRVEEYREDGNVVVRAELPDIDPDKDVEVSVEDGRLCISAERTQRTEHDDESGFRSEFRYGSFSRVLPLPAGVKPDDVVATYRDGILEVRVPVGEPEPARQKVVVTRT